MFAKKLATFLFVLIFLVGLTFIVANIVTWTHQSTAFSMNNVVVEGNRLLRTDKILKMIEIHQGKNITQINLEEIGRSVQSHPYIETALVSRRFPSTLKIEVFERVPVAFISGSKLFAVDRNGVLLPVMQSVAMNGLPVITGIENFREKLGERIDSDRVIQAIDLFNLIKSVDLDLFQNLSEVHHDTDKGFLVYFNNSKFPVYFGFDKYYEKAQKLKAFFRRVKQEQRYDLLQYVDLRFHEQVVAKFR